MTERSPITIRMRLLREALGLGRAEFARRIGISKKTLEGIEQSGRYPKSDVIASVCQEWPDYTVWLILGKGGTDIPQRWLEEIEL